jgi:hypothetical protein
MELNAKLTETDIVLVNDKILMALIGANGIKPVHVFMTGWPYEPSDFVREVYMAYKQTYRVKHLIKTFKAREVTVSLEDYLSSAQELEGYVGDMTYWPEQKKGFENE